VMAWTRFRQGNFLSLHDDADDDDGEPRDVVLEYY